jgi:hypothetical protein
MLIVRSEELFQLMILGEKKRLGKGRGWVEIVEGMTMKIPCCKKRRG